MASCRKRLVEISAKSYEKSTIRLVNAMEGYPYFAYALCADRHGNEVNGCLEGIGKVVFKDGHVYEGEFSSGVMDGCGKYTRTDGIVYEGQLKDCAISGQGQYRWTDNSSYIGEVVEGRRNGEGACYLGNYPTFYTGTWKNGLRNGKGKMVYKSCGDGDGDGDGEGESYYDGEWKDGKREGWGVMKYKSGNVYEGEWHNNKRHAHGTMYWKDSEEIYKGEWLEGKQHGQGEHKWAITRSDNSQYPLYNRYHGNWENGSRNGNGTFFYANGSYYCGEWRDNKKHGRGYLVLQSGCTVHCVFEEDLLVSSSSRPLEVTSGYRLPLRTKTPLTTLIGDVDVRESEGSRTERFNSSVSKLIPTWCNLEYELKQVHCVVLRQVSALKKVYHFYTKLSGTGVSTTGALTMLMLWQLIRDHGLHRHGMSLLKMSQLVEGWQECGQDHSMTLLMREFLQFLVHLSVHVYREPNYKKGNLSRCFSSLIRENFNKQPVVSGVIFSSEENTAAFYRHDKQLQSLYQGLSGTDHTDGGGVVLRRMLLKLKDSEILRTLATADVVNCLVDDVPLANNDGDYNMDYKMCYLEFCEAIFKLSAIFHDHSKKKSSVDLASFDGQLCLVMCLL